MERTTVKTESGRTNSISLSGLVHSGLISLAVYRKKSKSKKSRARDEEQQEEEEEVDPETSQSLFIRLSTPRDSAEE
jgi:hypothetical protein